MIDIIDKKNCCGCSACASICPKQCISMVTDNEGFLYPHVGKDSCIDCSLCEKVCNELHPMPQREPLQVLAAINKNEEIRLKSSSGGIFYVLAEKIISEGGVVFGARFDENWQVVIDYTETMNGVEALMGSKYVQARIENAYKDAMRFLIEGRKVLFSGTPCQIAGLYQFLKKQYDNLLTVDFICHGTPSPRVWGMYLDEVIKEGQRISNVVFRNKAKDWKNFSFSLMYNEEDETISMLSPFQQNHYMKAFLQDIILRPSCYDCKAKGCSSQSDLTIADFWGISTVFPEMDDDKGTGLVFANSVKGQQALDLSQIFVAETTYERIKPLNPSCYTSVNTHPKRKVFFSRLEDGNLIKLINDCTKPTISKRISMCKFKCKSLINFLRDITTVQSHNHIYSIPNNLQIVSVRFRNKDAGWKGYRMEIRLKENK